MAASEALSCLRLFMLAKSSINSPRVKMIEETDGVRDSLHDSGRPKPAFFSRKSVA
jgi:hypothetical protein